MKIRPGATYTTDQSNLVVLIHRVFYESDKYYKVKLSLIDKKYGYVYEDRKSYTLYKERIVHWSRDTGDDIGKEKLESPTLHGPVL